MALDHSLAAAFHPRAVAVVGASANPGDERAGASFVRSLQQAGFEGPIYPIHPKAPEVLGLRAYPSVSSLPQPPDLVVVSVPRREVAGVLEDCVRAGARNVTIYTSGFSETGEEEGKQEEQKLQQIALRGRLNMLGPNCMGLYVPSARISLWEGVSPQPGPVAFLAQSGGHCLQFSHYALGFGIRFSKVISFGNACLLGATDFLEYLKEDPETRIVALYLEGMRDGQRLVRLVREMNPTKPVIIWKAGLTEAGARAAASHTGSLAGTRQIWDTFFRQTGAVPATGLDELADIIMTFLYLKPLPGGRVALVSSGGGHSVASTDVCAREGLEVPALSPDTQRQLRDFIPLAGTSIRNPLDVERIQRDTSLLERVLRLVAADPLIDLVLINLQLDILHRAHPEQLQGLASTLTSFVKGQDKAVVAVLDSWGEEPAVRSARSKLRAELPKAGIPLYRSLPRAARALGRFVRYHQSLKAS